MSLKKIISEYTDKETHNKAERAKINARIEQREKQIQRLKARLDKTGYISWIDDLVEPIAKAMAEKMPKRRYEVLGPFGVGATTSIHFYKIGIEESRQFDSDNCKSITFRPKDLGKGTLVLVDYTRELPGFTKGSIGEMSGLQYPTIPIKNTVDELLQFMTQQEATS